MDANKKLIDELAGLLERLQPEPAEMLRRQVYTILVGAALDGVSESEARRILGLKFAEMRAWEASQRS